MLQLDWSKAAQQLGWCPALDLADALALTIDWYRDFLGGASAREKCLEQLAAYCVVADREVPCGPATHKNLNPAK